LHRTKIRRKASTDENTTHYPTLAAIPACFRKSPTGHYTESTRDDVTVAELRDCFLKRRLGGVDREFPQVRLQVHSVR
jgi:hypothetical protein